METVSLPLTDAEGRAPGCPAPADAALVCRTGHAAPPRQPQDRDHLLLTLRSSPNVHVDIFAEPNGLF